MAKILGIDYGKKKIGLALGFDDVVVPLMILTSNAGHNAEKIAINKIAEIVKSEIIDIVVIGDPYLHNFRQSESLSRDVKNEYEGFERFIDLLTKKIPERTKIIRVDEKLTSSEAQTQSYKYGISKTQRENDDAIAACGIIHRYIEERIHL